MDKFGVFLQEIISFQLEICQKANKKPGNPPGLNVHSFNEEGGNEAYNGDDDKETEGILHTGNQGFGDDVLTRGFTAYHVVVLAFCEQADRNGGAECAGYLHEGIYDGGSIGIIFARQLI
mgnify:CR=1 FL=1